MKIDTDGEKDEAKDITNACGDVSRASPFFNCGSTLNFYEPYKTEACCFDVAGIEEDTP